jgi:ABC-type uncharacterized transport system auxiliary subunit
MKIFLMMIWKGKGMKTVLYAVFLLILGSQSCGERTLIRHYYILEEAGRENYYADSTTLTNAVCEILDTEVPPAYAQLRIAIRKKSNEINYYQYNYWAMNPSDNLTFMLERQVRRARLFARVQSGLLKKTPDFQIRSNVYNLEVLDSEDTYYAHLQMDLELLEYDTGKILLSYSFDKTEPLEERTLNLFASQLSGIFQEETEHFIKKIRTYLEQRYTAQSP